MVAGSLPKWLDIRHDVVRQHHSNGTELDLCKGFVRNKCVRCGPRDGGGRFIYIWTNGRFVSWSKETKLMFLSCLAIGNWIFPLFWPALVAVWCTTLALSSAQLVAWGPSCAPARTRGSSSRPALWASLWTVSFNRHKLLEWKSLGSKLNYLACLEKFQHLTNFTSTQGGSQSHCVLSECRLVRGHHTDAAVVLVATPLGTLYVANVGAHGDGFNFLQVSHADNSIEPAQFCQIEFEFTSSSSLRFPADMSSSRRAGWLASDASARPLCSSRRLPKLTGVTSMWPRKS